MKRNFRYITKFEEETRSAQPERRSRQANLYFATYSQALAEVKKTLDEQGWDIKDWSSFTSSQKKPSEGETVRLSVPVTHNRYAIDGDTSEGGFDKEKMKVDYGQVEIQVYNKGNDTPKPFELNFYTNITKKRSSSARLEKRGYGLKATDVIGYAWEGELLTVEFVKHLFKTKQVEFDADSLKGRKDMNGIPEGLTANGEEYMPIFGSTELDESDRKMLEEGRSSSARLETRDWAKAGEMDEVGARELYLFADNESALQNQQKSIITNLARKFAKGAYDKDLAIKLWTYLADSASKLYSNANGGQFTPATRRETARMMEELHYPSVQDEAIDYKKRSSSAQLEKRGWFTANDEDEEEEKQPMSNNDAREEVRLYIMNTQGIYSAWMSMVDDACKQWLRTHDKEDDAPTFRDVVDDFTEIVRLGINEMNKSIDEDSENSEFPENNFSMADIKWIFEHSSAQEDLDEKWDWRKE